ncbi:MAG: FadR family transcriptional regulator [Firmicutes bacterium]|nr:FadR family transcriptional regulator [Bacillota bacterium]
MKQIASGELKAGDRLPPQSELAAQLGVSRTALREAVRSLSLMGLLSVNQGDGTFVSQVVPGLFVQPLSFMLLMDNTHILEVVEARAIIEVKTSRLCAIRATDEELEALGAIAKDMASCLDSLERFSQLDLDFHVQIARGTHNSVLVAVIETIQSPLLGQVERVQGLPGAAERAMDYHMGLVKALQRRDAKAASTMMLEHLDDVKDAVIAHARITQNSDIT